MFAKLKIVLNSWSLRRRISFSLIMLMTLLVVSGLIVILSNIEVRENILYIQEVAWPVAKRSQDTNKRFLKEELAITKKHEERDILIGGNDNADDEKKHENDFQFFFDSGLISKYELNLFDRLEHERHELIDQMLLILQETKRESSDSLLKLISEKHTIAMENLYLKTNELSSLLEVIEGNAIEAMNESAQSVCSKAKANNTLIFSIVIFLIISTIALIFLIRQSLTRPLTTLIEEIEKMGKHEISRIEKILIIPEFMVIGQAINQLVDKLKEAEDKRREMDRNLIQLERMASIGMVVSGLIHNLKNSLTPIMGYSEMLFIQNPELHLSEIIFKSAEQMKNMLEDVLARGRRRERTEIINLKALIERELDFLKADQIFRHRVQKEILLSEDIPSINGDYSAYSQVFANLLKNAVDSLHNRKRKLIKVVAKHDEKQITVEITDTGCGIQDENLNRIFDPFYTTKLSDDEVNGQQGTGLGLYTVKLLLESCGASLKVASEVNVGTTFKVIIPTLGNKNERRL